MVSPQSQSALPLDLIQSQMHCPLISNDSHLLKGLLFLAFQMQDQTGPGKNTKGEDDRPHRAAFEDITNVSIPAFGRTCLKYVNIHVFCHKFPFLGTVANTSKLGFSLKSLS